MKRRYILKWITLFQVIYRRTITRQPVILFDAPNRVDRDARARRAQTREERLSYQDNRMHAHSHDHASRYLLSAVHNTKVEPFRDILRR